MDIDSEVRAEIRDIDKRVTSLETMLTTVLTGFAEMKTNLAQLNQSHQKLEIKIAYACGVIGVITILAQIIIQSMFAR